jgi:hypothetical protein
MAQGKQMATEESERASKGMGQVRAGVRAGVEGLWSAIEQKKNSRCA